MIKHLLNRCGTALFSDGEDGMLANLHWVHEVDHVLRVCEQRYREW